MADHLPATQSQYDRDALVPCHVRSLYEPMDCLATLFDFPPNGPCLSILCPKTVDAGEYLCEKTKQS